MHSISSLNSTRSAFQGAHQHSSIHSAPPTVPPLPPPPTTTRPAGSREEIYAEVLESPPVVAAMPTLAGADYEDGYILNVESVPKKPRKMFGEWLIINLGAKCIV